MKNIQDYFAADSPPTDPFESLVEVYFQLMGYITSTNKWFWVWQSGKKQRGYQDIDVLAINKSETIIVSVTSNLDDKIRNDKHRKLHQTMLVDLETYYSRIYDYLQSVTEYQWIAKKPRTIRKVIAYASGKKLAINIIERLHERNIELLSSDEIIDYLQNIIDKHESSGLRTNNQLIKTMQLIGRMKNK